MRLRPGLLQRIAAVREFVEVFSGLGGAVEHGAWRDAEDLDNLVHLVHLVSRGGGGGGRRGYPLLPTLQTDESVE